VGAAVRRLQVSRPAAALRRRDAMARRVGAAAATVAVTAADEALRSCFYGLVNTGVVTPWNTLWRMLAVTCPPTPSQMPYWLLRIWL
jgi:hypothetical protein